MILFAYVLDDPYYYLKLDIARIVLGILIFLILYFRLIQNNPITFFISGGLTYLLLKIYYPYE